MFKLILEIESKSKIYEYVW